MVKVLNRPTACPLCKASLKPSEIRAAGRFQCPACHGEVQASEGYGQIIFWGTLLFLIGVFWLSGFRELQLFYAVLIALMPALFITTRAIKYVIPPGLEPYLPDLSFHLRDGPRL